MHSTKCFLEKLYKYLGRLLSLQPHPHPRKSNVLHNFSKLKIFTLLQKGSFTH